MQVFLDSMPQLELQCSFCRLALGRVTMVWF